MTARDVFGIIVRTIGLLLTLWGLGLLLAQVLDPYFTKGYYMMPYTGQPRELPSRLSSLWPIIIATLVLGIPLLFAASPIVNFLYKPEKDREI